MRRSQTCGGDRQLVAREPASLSSGGFGREVRDAMDARVEHLVAEGLAKRQGQRVIFGREMLDTLRRRELETTAARIDASTGVCLIIRQERASPSWASIGSAWI